ncbi:Retrovirus-related Pol polyprotein from transposon opus [Eumeta japonica]|uniref:Retrovirus-related Pol polyprotein from transposon opus n=1 Tax=Eumeta variegata TaxID=151549 RepID=A0A4C1STC8_EUMVA|nr:Retrovirus-related Pol polyprotein from transposon opus [Eumeta japonica]
MSFDCAHFTTCSKLKRLTSRSFPLRGVKLVPGSPILSERNKFPYRGIENLKLDCGDEVRHPSRLVFRKDETWTREVRFGTLNACGETATNGEDVYTLAVKQLDKYFSPKQRRVFECHLFRLVKQDVEEEFNKFHAKLKYQCFKRKFASPEEHVIDQITEKYIIESVNGPSDWISPLLPALKGDGNVRMQDMRRANRAIIREKRPLPIMEQLIPKFRKAKTFSKLDLKNSFHQLELGQRERYQQVVSNVPTQERERKKDTQSIREPNCHTFCYTTPILLAHNPDLELHLSLFRRQA